MKTQHKLFKVKGKKLYLIYNIHKPIHNIKERILDQLKRKLIYIDIYLIGEEKKEFQTSNIHCFIELKTPFETSSPKFFDIDLDGHIFSGEYKTGTRKKRIIEYILQLKSHINNINLKIE